MRQILRSNKKNVEQTAQTFSLDSLVGIVKTDFSDEYKDHLVAKYS